MVLLYSTPPAPLPVDVAATRPLVAELATSVAAREHVRTLTGTTYGRCVLGLAGFLTLATEFMAAFIKRMNGDVGEEDLKITHEILLLLAETVVDEDNATFIARIGAHPLLMRLMEHENEDIQEAAAEVVASCTKSPSAISFPHRVRQVGEVELLWPRAVPLPFDPRDNVPKNADGSQGTLNVLIRQVPTRMTGQRKTGYLLWGAAFVLARWIHNHCDLFGGKSVIEVGSGLGLGGITAARYAHETTLTDYQADTCLALEYNVQLNRPFTHEFDASKPEVKVSLLDWDVTESIEAVPKADVVIASDIICEPSTAEGFLRVVRYHLLSNPNGVAYLMNANSHSRFGVTHLHAILASSADLSYTITPVDDPKTLEPEPNTVGDSGLAIRYADVIIAARKMVMAPEMVGEDSRMTLYRMLPNGIRKAVRAKMRGNRMTMTDRGSSSDCRNDEDTLMAEGWREAAMRILEWLAPMANDTSTWQLEKSCERKRLYDPTAVVNKKVFALQTLLFSDKEKTEAAIVEVLVGLCCVCRYNGMGRIDDSD